MCDEDEPAPSPSATVVARRASREAKSMREESGCDEDTSSDEEWDPVQEQDEEDEEDERRVRRKHPLYSRSRLKGVSKPAYGASLPLRPGEQRGRVCKNCLT